MLWTAAIKEKLIASGIFARLQEAFKLPSDTEPSIIEETEEHRIRTPPSIASVLHDEVMASTHSTAAEEPTPSSSLASLVGSDEEVERLTGNFILFNIYPYPVSD